MPYFKEKENYLKVFRFYHLMRKIILFGLLLVSLLVIGCSSQVIEEKQIDSFDVKLLVITSSSGGTRTLDTIYTVENGEIISCDGVYRLDMMHNEKEEHPCELESILAEGYNIQKLITSISEDDSLKGEIVEGPITQQWEIILP